MNLRFDKTAFIYAFGACTFLLGKPSYAQLPQMSATQARQSLISYLLPPDTNLGVIPVTSTNSEGHTSYLFYGNGGGTYGMDAATAEKTIRFAGISGAAQTPATLPFSTAQFQQTAAAYVSQHFPNYSASTFQMIADSVIDGQSDADEYYVSFASLSTSGAEQPQHSLVVVEEDSGKIKSYEETAIPVVVSAIPAVTQTQAVQLGQNWIYQNISTDPAAGQFQTDLGGHSPIDLEVSVDPLLNQALIYNISYHSVVLTIDAQSGSILGMDQYLGISPASASAVLSPKSKREEFWEMHLSGSYTPLLYAAISNQGQLYIRENYLKFCGIATGMQAGKFTLSTRTKQLSLSLSQNVVGSSRVAWKRKKVVYIPLAAIQMLTNVFVKSSTMQEVSIQLDQSQKEAQK
jgi:hypothetical protein